MKAILLFLVVLSFPLHAAQPSKAEWTFLFYIGSDEEEVRRPTMEMLKNIEKTPGLVKNGPINVIAQVDDVDDDPNYRYQLLFQKDGNRTLEIQSPAIPEKQIGLDFKYKELDSGNVVTFKEFVQWGMQAYPAKHYAVIIGGHTWATSGVIQDFFDGEKLEMSSIIKLYELRRALEEVIREDQLRKTPLLKDGKFDLFFADACIMGQFEVALELEKQFKYFAGSSVEMPFHSVPYSRVFSHLLKALAENKEKKLSETELTEQGLIRPLIREFATSHGPQGELAKAEGEVDITAAFALRTDKLRKVSTSLKALTSLLLSKPYIDHREAILREIKPAADADRNADLYYLTELFDNYFQRHKKEDEKTWQKAIDTNLTLRKSLGVLATNYAVKPIALQHEEAEGAMLKIEVDTMPGKEMIACLSLRNLYLLNPKLRDALPTFLNAKGKKVDMKNLDCHEAALEVKYDAQQAKPLFEKAWKIKETLGMTLEWPTKMPGYLIDLPYSEVEKEKIHKGTAKQQKLDEITIAKRTLSLWIPKKGKTLQREVIARLPGSHRIAIDYLSQEPKIAEKYKSFTLKTVSIPVDPYQIVENPKKLANPDVPNEPGLYVILANSNGSYFKNGLGIYLNRKYANGYYTGGRTPIEQIEKEPYQLQVQQMMKDLIGKKAQNTYTIHGNDFYRLHRVIETGWDQFIFTGP